MLPGPFHVNEAGVAQFFQVMRYGRGSKPEPSAELTQTGAHIRRTRLPQPAATRQPDENLQPVRIGQGLEQFGQFLGINIWIIRPVSKY